MTNPIHADPAMWHKFRDWGWRVRRDILALEFVSCNKCGWFDLIKLFEREGLPAVPPLPSTEDFEITHRKVNVLLAALDYPPEDHTHIGGDPGAPPIPPDGM